MLKRTQKGMTLLELIIVIVILGILAALAIPTFAAVVTKSKFASAETTASALDDEALALAAFHTGESAISNTYPSNYLTVAASDLNQSSAVTTGGTAGDFIITENGVSVCLTPGTLPGVSATPVDITAATPTSVC